MKAKKLTVKALTPAQVDEWMKVSAPLNKKYASQVGQDLYDEFVKAISAASK